MDVFEEVAADGDLTAWLRKEHDKAGPTAIAERLAAALMAARKTPERPWDTLDAQTIHDGRDILEQALTALAVRHELLLCGLAELESRVSRRASD
jgi:hypothetical protein